MSRYVAAACVAASTTVQRAPSRARSIALGHFGSDPAERGARFARRVYRLRTLGLGLGALCVASVLRLNNASPWLWALLLLNGFVWPPVARAIALTSSNPKRAELRNLMIDSACGGAWIAIMQFNLLPSALLVAMLCVDKVAVGGVRLLLRSFTLLTLTAFAVSTALGWPLQFDTPMSVTIACIPFLLVYPLAISVVTFALSKRVARQNRHLAEIGRTDELTRLPNRQHGFAVARAELERFARYGGRCVLLVVDIDRFKDINDRYGHPVGDEVLCALAEILRESCRASDTPARYGGDEFIVVLPDTDMRGAERFAARVRDCLQALQLRSAPGLALTVSIGAAQANADTREVDAWIQRADAALYRAKAAGRDRFIAATAEVVSLRVAEPVTASD